ncbi:unnamed protein product [Dovyalis caffra]|uniref:Uncharacterized protein n=1 Tax=Dovyalis caffra TaxID=77055 RepID=A0AAV1SBM7_9ROSI|nr:unnamed protein product [Dovyalis caffra]
MLPFCVANGCGTFGNGFWLLRFGTEEGGRDVGNGFWLLRFGTEEGGRDVGSGLWWLGFVVGKWQDNSSFIDGRQSFSHFGYGGGGGRLRVLGRAAKVGYSKVDENM